MDREEQIMKYVMGEMTESELQDFEIAMTTDHLLAKEVEEMMEMQSFSNRRENVQKSKDVLSDIHEEFVNDLLVGQEKNKPLLRKMAGWFLLILASLILIGYLVKANKESTQPLDNQQLFAEHFQPEDASFQTKSSNSIPLSIQEAQLYFNQREYKKSAEKFLLKEADLTTDQRFYYGISLIGSGLVDAGINELQRVSSENKSYQNECRWYIALGQFKQEKRDDAIGTLLKIELSSSKHRISQKIIKKLTE